MTFETYARAWLEKQEFIKRTRKTTRQALEVYSFPVIGNKELTDIIDSDIDRIFYSVRLFNRKGDFVERTFRVLDNIFAELREKGITTNDPVLHIYDYFFNRCLSLIALAVQYLK